MAERGIYKKSSKPDDTAKDKAERLRPTLVSDPVKDSSPGHKEWRQSLRSRSPSPTSRTATLKTRPLSNSLSRSTSNGAKLQMTDSATRVNNSNNLNTTGLLEQEYIRSLQQQVYLLELENNHLRQQLMKATDLQPAINEEAQNMLTKIKNMQVRIDALELEIFRKDGNIEILNDRIAQLNNKLKSETASQVKEKETLLTETVEMRKQRDWLEREVARKDVQLTEIRDDYSMHQSNLKAAESKVSILRSKLDEQMEINKTLELNLADKRADLVKLESKLREMEDKFYINTTRLQESAKDEMRNEINTLRQRIKEVELLAENEKYLREKISSDSAASMKENASLQQQINDLNRQIEREKYMRENFDERRSQEFGDLLRLREKEKDLLGEVARLRKDLEGEKERGNRLLQQIAKQTLVHSSSDKQTVVDQHELQLLSTENKRLKSDKEYLIDHIDTLQSQIRNKDDDLKQLQNNIKLMEERIQQLHQLKSLEESLHSQRWQEVEKMADSLRSQSLLLGDASSAGRTPSKSAAQAMLD